MIMELDGCRICELFGGPHAEHAGWHGASVGRSAALPASEEIWKRVRIEQAYRDAREVTEGDEGVIDFIDAMSQGVTSGWLGPEPVVWGPTADTMQGSRPHAVVVDEAVHFDVHSTPIPHDSRSVDRQLIVEPGWVRAPQAERGAVPLAGEPSQSDVDRLLSDALASAYVGQTVRLTVLDSGTGERATFSVIKREELLKLDRIRELETKIRNDLQEREGDRDVR